MHTRPVTRVRLMSPDLATIALAASNALPANNRNPKMPVGSKNSGRSAAARSPHAHPRLTERQQIALALKESANFSTKAMVHQASANSGRAAAIRERLPYIFLALCSLSTLFFLVKAGESGSPESSFAHNVGLFFFSGAGMGECSSLPLRISYFVLHLQMSLLISIICKANRSPALGMPPIVRRVLFFSIGYAAVGIAAPVLLAFTGDASILDYSHVDDGAHLYSASFFDDSDFDTYATLFINVGWFLTSNMVFGITTCSAEYTLPAVTTLFDNSVMIWAICLLLPLFLYNKRRALFPVFWSRFGFTNPGSGYRGLALLNGIFVCAFAVKELLSYNALDFDSGSAFISALSPSQQSQIVNNRYAAYLDYLFMTVTMAVFVLRHVGWSGFVLAFSVLLCPPVALPLFLSKMSASGRPHTRSARSVQ